MKDFARIVAFVIAVLTCATTTLAQDAGEDDEYKPVLPDVTIYKAMLDANKTTGWVQFRNFSGKQLIYFTALQTMHCRLSEIRYSVNSEMLDKRFPLGKCNPQIPFNLPAEDGTDYILITMPADSVETIAIQAVWDDGAGSEIVVYKPCEGVGDATCAAIKTIKKPGKQMLQPAPADSPVRSVQEDLPGKSFSEPSPSSAARP